MKPDSNGVAFHQKLARYFYLARKIRAFAKREHISKRYMASKKALSTCFTFPGLLHDLCKVYDDCIFCCNERATVFALKAMEDESNSRTKLTRATEEALLEVLTDPTQFNRSFRSLCNERQEVFGATGSRLRRQVQQRRHYLLQSKANLSRAFVKFVGFGGIAPTTPTSSVGRPTLASPNADLTESHRATDLEHLSTPTPVLLCSPFYSPLRQNIMPIANPTSEFDYELNLIQPWLNPDSILALMGERAHIDGVDVGTRVNIYFPVLCLHDWHNRRYELYFNKKGDMLHLEKPSLAHYQAHRAGYIQSTESEAHKCAKIEEQHRCVASTLSRQNSHSLLTQRLNLSLPDGLKGTNSAYNDGATGNSLNLRLRKIGIRYTAKNGRTEDQVLYFAVASFLIQGSQIPWSEGRAGTKEEDELADLLGVDPVTVQLSDDDSIICDSDEESSFVSNNGCEDLLGATADGISRIVREGKELLDSMHVDAQERVKRGHQEISRDFSSLETAAAGRDHGFASKLEEYDDDL
ncbi:hypothetical protein IV203_023448 [Nitzschia inconspicua]|uniref:Uncharacterized protein n=1 Tax=Nitzschia inconspicua TaxID=303405 RepID=A0A9K3KDN4_9STRA|nr:hypothetical protein IV203_023448 [Nitzschia inconspicua]